MNKSELKELVKEELNKIQENKALTVEESYYKFFDGVYGLINMKHENGGYDKDKFIKKRLSRSAKKLLMDLDKGI